MTVLARLDEIADKLKSGGVVRIGFLENSTYPDGTSVPMIAAINEFGAPSRGQPPRPFFRRMIAKDSPGWSDAVATNLKDTDYDANTTLARMGEGISGQLRQSIVDLVDPPLAESTIRAKGFDKPLIDTGHMWKSVQYEISTNGQVQQFEDFKGTGKYSLVRK